MGGLASRVASPPARPFNGQECSVGACLRDLPNDESRALQAMLDRPGEWTANMIYDAVTAEGHLIGRQTIGRHRRGTCKCFAKNGDDK